MDLGVSGNFMFRFWAKHGAVVEDVGIKSFEVDPLTRIQSIAWDHWAMPAALVLWKIPRCADCSQRVMMVTIVTCQAETVHGHVSCTTPPRFKLDHTYRRPSSVSSDWQDVKTEASPP